MARCSECGNQKPKRGEVLEPVMVRLEGIQQKTHCKGCGQRLEDAAEALLRLDPQDSSHDY